MKTQEMKANPLTSLLKKALMDLPTPASISFLWNMGFLLGAVLMLQIATGLFVSMIYFADTNFAFSVMVKIMRDNSMGWTTRTLHANGASLFFVLLYTHTARGLYFTSSKNQKKVWLSGVAILLATMATAFLGYVLPWGQMSFWGATVITGVLSAIPILGNDIVIWIWGGPSVSQPTLNRFFSLHFILPMLILAMVMAHLMLLHEKGSSTPTNTKTNLDKIKFNPLFTFKDSLPMVAIALMMVMMIFNWPNLLGDVENFNPANPLVAPLHIQPEWYFLFAYVILRSVPSKLGGVVALAASVLVLSLLIFKKSKSTKFIPLKKMKNWILIATLLILTWIGAKTVESPFEGVGQIYSVVYFMAILSM